MKFSIVIASHGDDSWRDLAHSRAYPSAQGQDAYEILIKHDPNGTRASVRNRLLARATGDWIVTLDADDELAPGYIGAMQEAAENRSLLLTPRVQYVRKRPEEPKFWPEVDLRVGNWMVVGTAAPCSLMLQVGGWRTFMGSGVLNEWDDWDMWIRCVQAGADIIKVPDAIYIAHIQASSNHHYRASRKARQFWLQEIQQANYP